MSTTISIMKHDDVNINIHTHTHIDSSTFMVIIFFVHIYVTLFCALVSDDNWLITTLPYAIINHIKYFIFALIYRNS